MTSNPMPPTLAALLRPDERIVVVCGTTALICRTWRTPAMPAPAFTYYLYACAGDTWICTGVADRATIHSMLASA